MRGLIAVAVAIAISPIAANAAPVKEWPKRGPWQAVMNRLENGHLQCLVGNDHQHGEDHFSFAMGGELGKLAVVVLDNNRARIATETLTLKVDNQYFGRFITVQTPGNEGMYGAVVRPNFDIMKGLEDAMATGETLKLASPSTTYSFGLNGFYEADKDWATCAKMLKDKLAPAPADDDDDDDDDDDASKPRVSNPPRPSAPIQPDSRSKLFKEVMNFSE